MYTLIFFFLAGMLTALVLRGHENIIKLSHKLSEWCVILLLFILGFLMGANPSIMKNLVLLGIDAGVISFFSILGSILFILPLRKKIK